jgi:small subunit ribosomal protein S6
MREYELLYIVHPDHEGDQLKEVVGKYADLVSSQGGEVLKVEEWSKQKLAYPIRKCTKGQYVLMTYLGPSKLTHELERILRLDEPVLKYLTVKLSDNPDPEKRRQEIAALKAKAEEQRARTAAEEPSARTRRREDDDASDEASDEASVDDD